MAKILIVTHPLRVLFGLFGVCLVLMVIVVMVEMKGWLHDIPDRNASVGGGRHRRKLVSLNTSFNGNCLYYVL